MFTPEYMAGFSVLRKQIGAWPAVKIGTAAVVKARKIHFEPEDTADAAEKAKANLKNHFVLLAEIYKELRKRYGAEKSNGITREIILTGGKVYLKGFTPLREGDDLKDFSRIYREFECNNIVFDVIEDSPERFEIVVTRCLVFEAFEELGVSELAQWMCDVAIEYFNEYHFCIEYQKDRMIARGDDTCHEVFLWGNKKR